MAGVIRGVAACEGGGLSLEEAYAIHYGRLVAWLVLRTRDQGLAEDLAQDTFVRFAGAADSFDHARPVWPYLRAIAANVLIDHARRAERQVVAPAEVIAESLPQEPVVEDRVVLSELLDAGFASLSDRQQIALELRYVRDWGVDDAAAFLGITPGSFRQLSMRARRTLSTWLEQVEGGVRGIVVPAVWGLRERVRSWSTRVRELVHGPAPAVTMEAVTSVVLVAGLSLSAAAPPDRTATNQAVSVISIASATLNRPSPAVSRADAIGHVESSDIPRRSTSSDSVVRPDGPRTEREHSTSVRASSPSIQAVDAQGEVAVEEGEERYYTSHDIEVGVPGRGPIFARGVGVWIECDNLVGEVLCSEGQEVDE